MTYSATHDPKLKEILDHTVAGLLSTQTPDGCISAHDYPLQLKNSDVWERKYVLLGLESYYAITRSQPVLDAMARLAAYTIGYVGPPPKVRIVDTGYGFEGIASSSILEPIVKLYDLTGSARYLDFARYIVEQEGACKRGSIFQAAFDGVTPWNIASNGNRAQSIDKAYEMTSCFEGLAEYYRATGNDHWNQAALAYYKGIRDQEITLIGSGGGDKPYNHGIGTGEQWNNTALEQTNPDMSVMMETCVTVTWMKFCYQLLRLTGDSKIADQIELSAYNALAGAQKPAGIFYDYFQPLNGARNGRVNYSETVGGIPLSCCTANGPSGMALIPAFAAMTGTAGPVINLYAPFTAIMPTPSGGRVKLTVATNYPRTGHVAVQVEPEKQEHFTIRLRVPEWSGNTHLAVNGQPAQAIPGTYTELSREWQAGDKIEMTIDMSCRLIHAPHGVNRKGDPFQALVRGPIVLSRDKRLGGDIHQPVEIQTDASGLVPLTEISTEFSQVAFSVPLKAGGSFPVIDYASAGRTWDATSEFMTWLPTAKKS